MTLLLNFSDALQNIFSNHGKKSDAIHDVSTFLGLTYRFDKQNISREYFWACVYIIIKNDI